MTQSDDLPRRAPPVVICSFCLEHNREYEETCHKCHMPLRAGPLNELLGGGAAQNDAKNLAA